MLGTFSFALEEPCSLDWPKVKGAGAGLASCGASAGFPNPKEKGDFAAGSGAFSETCDADGFPKLKEGAGGAGAAGFADSAWDEAEDGLSVAAADAPPKPKGELPKEKAGLLCVVAGAAAGGNLKGLAFSSAFGASAGVAGVFGVSGCAGVVD